MNKILDILLVVTTLLTILVFYNYVYGEEIYVYRIPPGFSSPITSMPDYIIDGNTIYRPYPGTYTKNTLGPKWEIRSQSHEWSNGYQHRADQPLQQEMPYVWPPQTGKRAP